MNQALKLQEYINDAQLREVNHLLPIEYLLVLQPHEALWNEIKFIKEKFAKDFDCETARWGLPHITLAVFKQYQATESHVRQALRNSIKTLQPFKIEMKGFWKFPFAYHLYKYCKQGTDYECR